MELDHESVHRLDPDNGGSYVATRVIFNTTRPNGLAITPDMKTLYVAQSGPGAMIYIFSRSGRILEMHPFPFDPTNCAFGGKDLQSLFVASKDGYLYRTQTSRSFA